MKHIREHKQLFLGVVILGIVVVAAMYNLGIVRDMSVSGGNGLYQAVFLSNGQVYFGSLSDEEGHQFIVLQNVFYLQVTQPPQPLKQGEVPPTNINLVKLGGELHGPTDEMRINRDQVLFIEDMKSDSRVTQAIEAYKKINPGQ